MEQYKRHRKVLRTAFSKFGNELEQLLTAEGTKLENVQVNWELLQEKHDSLQDINKNIFNSLLEANVSEEELEAEMDSCDGYVKRFKALKQKYEQLQNTNGNVDDGQASIVSRAASNLSGTTGKRKFKLPIIEFKKFSGDVRDWLSFWGQFKKINDDANIDTDDKFQYLLQATVPNSRARELVESFPPNAENYKNVIDSLKSRFGRDDLQIEVYVRELLKLIMNNAMSTNKMDLSTLYDKIETQLRSLETLGVTSENCSAMLFPLIESCLPEDLLRVWQRSTSFYDDGSSTDSCFTTKTRLQKLMIFLKSEVENEERISLAAEGFGLCQMENRSKLVKPKKFATIRDQESHIPSATGLMNCDVAKCIFCERTHDSHNCFKAQKYTMEQKRNVLNEKKACYRCLRNGHPSRKCRERLRCLICNRSHVALMCPDLPINKSNTVNKSNTPQKPITEEKNENDMVPLGHVLANYTGTHVFLQTLRVKIVNGKNSRYVRLVIDTGSQRSYILKSTVTELGFKQKRLEKIVHSLFGGSSTSVQTHNCYDVKLVGNDYSCTLEALDQQMICNDIAPVFAGPWMDELRSLDVHISDIMNPGPIEMLIGADVIGKLYTGRKHNLRCGLVAIETLLGWTLMGKIPPHGESNGIVTSLLSLLVNDFSLKNLWELDILGIEDPVERKSQQEMAQAAKDLFLQTIYTNVEGRYEVRLPWLEGHPPLPNNLSLAKKRLAVTLKRLNNAQLFESYDNVFKEWLQEGIIEEIKSTHGTNQVHYLPHRPVIKESSNTTKIRPVFDASARERDKPSLNHCVEKGPNLIESIPSILIRFRKEKIAVVSDIRKAFLQISLHEADRDFLRFLWVDENGQEIVYRHRRVVFGVNCSPFLLGATIEYHLNTTMKQCLESGTEYCKETVERLANCFYVDNCVTSLPDEVSVLKFIREASIIMAEGKFDLRGWEFTKSDGENEKVTVLGLIWNPVKDTLRVNAYNSVDLKDIIITKRVILSMTQKVFDPIGFTSPATLYPKILLQSLWKKQLRWDDPVDDESKNSFTGWLKELPYLEEIQVPRWIDFSTKNIGCCSLHTFVDASKNAYAAVIFLRVQGDGVSVHLIAAKSRVKPLKDISIPRMELLAANIGARLYDAVKQNFEPELESYFWSDSSTVISWIRRSELWTTFVGNRVQEIRLLTSTKSWRHVSGTLNPADLPSRGCSPRQLYESRWWEGPKWLYDSSTHWPHEEILCDEEEVIKERKKSLITTMLNHASDYWHIEYFSKYNKTLRMVAWIFRFIHNIKNPSLKKKDSLSVFEIHEAEKFLIHLIQQECFCDEKDNRLNSLCPFKDDYGLIRLKSRISRREDIDDFRFPIVLPAKHSVVHRLIFDTHLRLCHIGTEGLLSNLREKYWILGGRRAIRSIIKKCVICRRYNAKNFQNSSPPLPLDRVRDAVAFEITGIDFAGPLYLKSGEKTWICIFTCAVYRAIHLELTSSLSTHGFIQCLRRFVARRGRPSTIYSDNGSNFIGAENAFSRLNWSAVTDYASTQRISWKFNPPTAAWWGGFWERLVGVLKQLLRRVLGRSSLCYEDLMTILCDCEATVNSRPITYLADSPNDLIALTPAMFLRELAGHGMPDCDAIDRDFLNRKMAYKQKLRENLRNRFRNEYLGQLKLMTNQKHHRQVVLGEIVLIGNDHDKRLDWPLGRITQLIPGRDNKIRLVQVTTSKGTLLRPIQRIYPLECIEIAPDIEDLRPEAASYSRRCVPKQEGVQEPDCPGSEYDVVSAGVSDVNSDIKSRAIANSVSAMTREHKCNVPNSATITRIGRVCKPPRRLCN